MATTITKLFSNGLLQSSVEFDEVTMSAATAGSAQFSGSNYLSVPNNVALNPGTGNFTIEFWVNLNSTTNNASFWRGNNNGVDIFMNGTGKLALGQAQVSTLITDSVNMTTGSWVHVAAVKNGSTITLYKNGVSVGSSGSAPNFVTDTINYIGNQGSFRINGYMTNLRVVIGSAVYTGTFTPPTSPLTAISGTQLLLLEDTSANLLKDISTNNFTVTNNNSVIWSSSSPSFASSSQIKVSANGVYAAEFNELGDDLTPITTSGANNYNPDGTSAYFFRVYGPLHPSEAYERIQPGWTCVQIPGSVVVSNVPDSGDNDESCVITITGGTFIQNTFYSFSNNVSVPIAESKRSDGTYVVRGSFDEYTLSTVSIVTNNLIFNLASAPSSGTTWTDASGNGYNATLQGSASYVSTYGGGIKLNNSVSTGTDYISVPYNISTSNVTVEIVASFNPTAFWATIWGNEGYTAGRGYYAFMSIGDSITYGKPNSASAETITPSSNVRHWVFVINGTTQSLYLNGSQVGTSDTVANQTLFALSELYFGARHTNGGTGPADRMNNSNTALQPVFYQMRVYNKPLSVSEISQNYNAIKSTYGI